MINRKRNIFLSDAFWPWYYGDGWSLMNISLNKQGWVVTYDTHLPNEKHLLRKPIARGDVANINVCPVRQSKVAIFQLNEEEFALNICVQVQRYE